MNKKVKRTLLATFGAVGVVAAVAACGPTQLSDLRNTQDSYPNFQTTILNVSGFPNVSILCFDGTAFATTTRDNSASAAFLAPSLNSFCVTQEGKKAGVVNPNTGNN